MIELMVTVSVLSIGIILIARSFLSASGALSSCESRIIGLNFLEGKMAQVEEKAVNGEDDLTLPEESVLINGKTANFKSGIEEIRIGKPEDELSIKKVMLNVGWSEANRPDNEDLSVYVETKKKE